MLIILKNLRNRGCSQAFGNVDTRVPNRRGRVTRRLGERGPPRAWTRGEGFGRVFVSAHERKKPQHHHHHHHHHGVSRSSPCACWTAARWRRPLRWRRRPRSTLAPPRPLVCTGKGGAGENNREKGGVRQRKGKDCKHASGEKAAARRIRSLGHEPTPQPGPQALFHLRWAPPLPVGRLRPLKQAEDD